MRINIITIFPEIFNSFISTSLIAKAIENNLIDIQFINPRIFALPPHNRVDDTPYGGGPGMVLMAEPLIQSVEAAKKKLPNAKVILLSATGQTLTQSKAKSLKILPEVILVCGRYEGVDQRFVEQCVDEELSIGNYILMGGEIPAMVLIETVARLLPGVLGNSASTESESFSSDEQLLEAPHYTKPAEVRGLKVPDALLSGNHAKIEMWRKQFAKKPA